MRYFRVPIPSLQSGLTGLAALALMSGSAQPLAAQTAAEPARTVSLELVLAVDVSASVDDGEYQLQIQGLADAFRQADIIDAIMQHRDGVAVAVVQWSDWTEAVSDPPWRLLRARESILEFAAEIETSARRRVGHLTAIGGAIDFSVELMETNEFDGRRRKIDVSGDGQSNSGGPAADARDRAVSKGITISGLAILTDEPTLVDYYERLVAGGPAAFVLHASSYDDFAEAIARKLLRELDLQLASGAATLAGGRASLSRRSVGQSCRKPAILPSG